MAADVKQYTDKEVGRTIAAIVLTGHKHIIVVYDDSPTFELREFDRKRYVDPEYVDNPAEYLQYISGRISQYMTAGIDKLFAPDDPAVRVFYPKNAGKSRKDLAEEINDRIEDQAEQYVELHVVDRELSKISDARLQQFMDDWYRWMEKLDEMPDTACERQEELLFVLAKEAQ